MATRPERGQREFAEQREPLLLYDGTCGFCDAYVQFVLRYDRRRTARFAALQSELGQALSGRHPLLATIDSVVWVENMAAETERLFVKSDAIFRVGTYLGGPWALLGVGRIVPRAMRDAVYDFLAKHRHHLPGFRPQCVIPPPDAKHRFIDR